MKVEMKWGSCGERCGKYTLAEARNEHVCSFCLRDRVRLGDNHLCRDVSEVPCVDSKS